MNAEPDHFRHLAAELLPVIHADDELVAASKPSGIDTGRLDAAGSDGLRELLPLLRPDVALGEPVNRLSRFESGVVVFCGDAALRDRLRGLWNAGKVIQEYVLVARGRVRKRTLTISGAPSRSDRSRHADEDRRESAGAEHRDRGAGAREGKRAGAALALRDRRSSRERGRAAHRSAPTSSGAIQVEVVHRGEHRLVLRCRTTLRSTHALKAALRAAGLHPLGDTRGGERGMRDRPQRACLHLQRVSFTHPFTGRAMRFNSPLPAGFEETAEGREPLEALLHKALARRIEMLLDDTTDAWRVLTGDAEGVPGVVLEKYADLLVMHLLDGRNLPPRADRQHLARLCQKWLNVRSVYPKLAPRDRSNLPPEEAAVLAPLRPLLGPTLDGPIIVTERGLRFETHPLDPLAAGIYLDHRVHRQRVRELAEGKHVLNLFAYTCAFSVAAVAGGAALVDSVDQSKRALDWGKRNFALNGLPLAPHRFLCDEVFDYLARAARRESVYDLIILDPPTFARMKRGKTTFHVENDLPSLVAAAMRLLAHDGTMLVASNFRSLSHARFQALVRQGTAGRRVRLFPASPLPADFAPDPQHHKAVWVKSEAGDLSG